MWKGTEEFLFYANSSPGIDMTAEVSMRLGRLGKRGEVDAAEADGMALKPLVVRR
jgi:hypothetical protein